MKSTKPPPKWQRKNSSPSRGGIFPLTDANICAIMKVRGQFPVAPAALPNRVSMGWKIP
jgi:hypothetical protein